MLKNDTCSNSVKKQTNKNFPIRLFITIPWFLPAYRAGGPIQSIANLVKQFDEDIQYYIFCGNVDFDGSQLEVQTGKWMNFHDNTKVWYSATGKSKKSILEQVENIKPDILFIIGLFSLHYNIVPLLYCKAPRKIISARGMLHPGALSQKRWKKKIYLGIFKLLGYHHKVQFHASDIEEKKYINQYFGDVSTFVAGNFPTKIDTLPIVGKEHGILKLVSIAIISPMKNIMMVLEALKSLDISVSSSQKVNEAVRAQHDILRQAQDDTLRSVQDKTLLDITIQYDIYGPIKDVAYWEKCLKLVSIMPTNVTVRYHGDIHPSQVKEALSESHVFILPSKSENFGHAIYEALAAGRPVITSNNTPWNNLRESNAGINVSTDNKQELEKAIVSFAEMDQEELCKWSLGANHFANEAVDFNLINKQYRDMFFGETVSNRQ